MPIRTLAIELSINLPLPRGPGRIITIVESAFETKAKTMTRMRDVDPSREWNKVGGGFAIGYSERLKRWWAD